MNKVEISGGLIARPEPVHNVDGTPMYRFCIAVNKADGSGECDFFDCVCVCQPYDTNDRVLRFVTSGNKIQVVGSLSILKNDMNYTKIVVKAATVKFGT